MIIVWTVTSVEELSQALSPGRTVEHRDLHHDT